MEQMNEIVAIDKKRLPKAERRKLAAEAFSKSGAAPTRSKLQQANARSSPIVIHKQMDLFSHLSRPKCESSIGHSIHPSILALGLKYTDGRISGSNARAVALLTAFKHVIMDYMTPAERVLQRSLAELLLPSIQHLVDRLPHSIDIDNPIRSLHTIIANTPLELGEDEAKKHILSNIENFIQNRIILAIRTIAKYAQAKIVDGDVILTYARSNVIELMLKEAHEKRKISFRVVVVDSRPQYEGTFMVQRLANAGIQCTYIQITALAYVMREVTKVFLGASAFMSNGVAVGRIGTALVAMNAHEANVPVLFCCETYKFSDRVQLDAITHNELRDADELVSSVSTRNAACRNDDVLSDWREIEQLKLLNLSYDITPIEYVSMIVTELGMIPPTSIPAILREYSNDV